MGVNSCELNKVHVFIFFINKTQDDVLKLGNLIARDDVK
jgi:hypothetical protein